VKLPESMTASRDSIRSSLIELESHSPGYLKKYLEQHLSTQKKIVITPNDDATDFVDISASTAACGHSVNFAGADCFICWLKREFNEYA
jgi:hypothetical protein